MASSYRASAALSVVLREHRGYLGSYEQDAWKRLVLAYRLVKDVEAEVEMIWRTTWRAACVTIPPLRLAVVAKLLALVPEYVPESSLGELAVHVSSEVLGAYQREIRRRRREYMWSDESSQSSQDSEESCEDCEGSSVLHHHRSLRSEGGPLLYVSKIATVSVSENM